MFAPKKILVPTDYSLFSDKALKQAIDIAKQQKATLYLLHVIGFMQACSVDYCVDVATMEAVEKQSTEAARQMMDKQIARVAGGEDVMIVKDVRQGTPYDEILREQKEKGMDLIVIASHGSTGLLHHLMGSVADKVSRHAECPVLLVRG